MQLIKCRRNEKFMTRHQMREAAFLLTFEQIFSKDTVDDIVETAKECELFEINDQAIELFNGIVTHRDDIDEIITHHLKNWTLARISKVSLAVLRVAIYEMKYCDEILNDIVISEAVIIAQTYTLKDEVNFVNGVLSSIYKGI